MTTDIPELGSSGLRKFGLMMAGVIAVLFGLVLPWLYGRSSPLWTWVIAAVLAAWSLILPSGLRLVYRWWMKVALVVGNVNTMMLLSIVFLFMIAPAGVIMRLFGYDPLQRNFVPFARSYRKPGISKKADAMEKPF